MLLKKKPKEDKEKHEDSEPLNHNIPKFSTILKEYEDTDPSQKRGPNTTEHGSNLCQEFHCEGHFSIGPS